MNEKELAGRRPFVWRSKEPVEANISRFADAIADKLVAELFNVNGGLCWFNAGKLVPADLRALIGHHFISVRLGGTVDKPNREVEYFSFGFPLVAKMNREPDKGALHRLEAALLERVAKGPQEQVKLSERQQQNIQARFKIGEPVSKLANEYGVDDDVIRQVGAR